MGRFLKRFVYRFACWLERRAASVEENAIQLQDWAVGPPLHSLQELIVGGINRDPCPFWKNNALLDHLKDRKLNG